MFRFIELGYLVIWVAVIHGIEMGCKSGLQGMPCLGFLCCLFLCVCVIWGALPDFRKTGDALSLVCKEVD